MRELFAPLESDDAVQNKLSAREQETLLLFARGMVPKEVARTLMISEKTVRNHLRNIYRKLSLTDRTQIVVYALKRGLIDLNAL